MKRGVAYRSLSAARMRTPERRSRRSETGAWITGECVAAVGAVPGFIGVAYLLLWLAKRGSTKS